MMPCRQLAMRKRFSSASPCMSASMRPTVRIVSVVWRVASTRWPVSAALSAISIVSSSRIFPDEDDVRILAQRRAKRGGEARRVDPDLSLADARHQILVHELDRVFDRHDVQRAGRVQVRDHARDRRALAVARRADDEHHPVLLLDELLRHGHAAARGAPSRNVGRDEAHHDRERAALAVHVHAEPPDAGRESTTCRTP